LKTFQWVRLEEMALIKHYFNCMMKFNKHAFAIRYKDAAKADKKDLYEFFRVVAKQYPEMTIEGNSYGRGNIEAITAVTRLSNLLIATVGEGRKKKKTNKDLIVIGAKGKFDVSYVASKDVKIGGFYPLIPIYSIEDNAIDIVKGLNAYLENRYPVTAQLNKRASARIADECGTTVVVHIPETKPVIKEYSTHVMVGDQVLSWEDYYAWEEAFEAKSLSKEVKLNTGPTLGELLGVA